MVTNLGQVRGPLGMAGRLGLGLSGLELECSLLEALALPSELEAALLAATDRPAPRDLPWLVDGAVLAWLVDGGGAEAALA